MIAFEVYLNGKRLCTAGIVGGGVLSALLSWSGGNRPNAQPKDDDLHFRVGGLINRTNEHVRWTDREVEAGDEIRINIVETIRGDRPPKRGRTSGAETRRRQKARVRQMAKEFGWKIQK